MIRAINLAKLYPAGCNFFSTMLLVFIASFLVLPNAKQVNNVFYILLAAPALIAVFRYREALRPHSATEWLWLLFLVTAAVMGALGGGSAQYFKHIGYIWLFTFAITALVAPVLFRHPCFGRGLFWTVGLYIVGSAIYYWSTGEYAVGQRILWLPGRMTGPIYTSMWLIACFALATPAWLKEKRYIELFAAFILSAACIGFILQSRSGFVGLLALPFLLFLATKTRISARSLIAVLVTFLVLLIATWNTDLLQHLLARGDAHRFTIWQGFLARWWECGLLQGCGTDFKEVFFSAGAATLHAHPHNIFLSIGSKLGVIALLLFLATMLSTLWHARKHQDPWGLYLAVSLIMLNFDGSLIIGNPDELWLLVLLPMALLINRYRPPLSSDSKD